MRTSVPVLPECLLLALTAIGGVAQPFTFGVKIGVPLTDLLSANDTFGTSASSYTNRYLVGPTLELNLPFRLGVEVDALYRHYRFQSLNVYGFPSDSHPFYTVSTDNRESTGAWEFPLLAKYRLPVPLLHPFVDAGISWDTLQGFHQSVSVTVTPIMSNPPVPIQLTPFGQPAHSTITGFVIGGGVDVHALFVHVTPEIRYTHWGKGHFIGTDDGFWSNRNQAEVMVGITF